MVYFSVCLVRFARETIVTPTLLNIGLPLWIFRIEFLTDLYKLVTHSEWSILRVTSLTYTFRSKMDDIVLVRCLDNSSSTILFK